MRCCHCCFQKQGPTHCDCQLNSWLWGSSVDRLEEEAHPWVCCAIGMRTPVPVAGQAGGVCCKQAVYSVLLIKYGMHVLLQDCPGYFGHIELAKAMYHIGFIRVVLRVLRCVSYYNSKIMVEPVGVWSRLA